MIAGTVCYLASIVLTSVCNRYYQYILSQGVLFGLAVGLLWVQLCIVNLNEMRNETVDFYLGFILQLRVFQHISQDIAPQP